MSPNRFLFFLLCLFIGRLGAQPYPTFAVHFTSKAPTPYTFQRPGEFLSPAALERRARALIRLDSSDLPVSPTLLDSVRKAGGTIIGTSRWLNAALVTMDSARAMALVSRPFVKKVVYVRPSVVQQSVERRLSKLDLPVEVTDIPPPFSSQYGMGWYSLTFHGGTSLHRRGRRGKGVRVALLDAGFLGMDSMSAFAHLFQDGRILDAYDFVAGRPFVYGHHSHGTLVLSTIAADAPGYFMGLAPEAAFMLYRTENGAEEYLIEEYFWAMGAERADSAGADIINSSLGYTTFDHPAMNHTYQDMDGWTAPSSRAASMAAQKGIIVVVSAGNWGADRWHHISAPSDARGILCVGAVDSQRRAAAFSGRGPSADGRTKPDIAAYGVRVPCLIYNSTDPGRMRLIRASGTSLSAPMISGMTAALLSAFPSRRPHPRQILEAIKTSAHLAPLADDVFGYGIPHFDAALTLLQQSAALWKDTTATWHFIGQSSDQPVRVFDLNGRQVAEFATTAVESFRKGQQPAPHLAPGTYIIRTPRAAFLWWNPRR